MSPCTNDKQGVSWFRSKKINYWKGAEVPLPKRESGSSSLLILYFLSVLDVSIILADQAFYSSTIRERHLSWFSSDFEISKKVSGPTQDIYQLPGWLIWLWVESGIGFPGNSAGKGSFCNAGGPGFIPKSGRSPGEGIGYPPQYLGLPWWLCR